MNLSQKHIVIADDNEDFCFLLSDILKTKGYEQIDTVGDGYELVALLEKANPSVIVLDLMMPGKDGVQVFDSIKTISPYSRIIIYTGYDHYKDSVYARKSDRFVLKGADFSELLQAIKELA